MRDPRGRARLVLDRAPDVIGRGLQGGRHAETSWWVEGWPWPILERSLALIRDEGQLQLLD